MLIDTTLREGAQLFGVYLDERTRAALLTGLLRLGAEEIELGWVGQEGLAPLLHWARDTARETASRSAFSLWCPCRDRDIRMAASLGVTRINLGLPASDAHLAKRLGIGRSKALDLAGRSISLAQQLGIREVSLGLEDVSRADMEFALELAQHAERAGAWRIRLADTVGLLSPLATADMVRRFRQALTCRLAAHCHNDFGMATANAVSALDAGADYVDVSLLGMGERAGIAAAEELAAWLVLRRGRGTYDLGALKELCALAAGAANLPLPRTKAVVGEDIFACETGLHAQGLARDPGLFEPFAPEAVNAERRLGLGAKSGRAAVRSALEENGAAGPESLVGLLTGAVRRLSQELGRPLSPGEFSRLAAETAARAAN